MTDLLARLNDLTNVEMIEIAVEALDQVTSELRKKGWGPDLTRIRCTLESMKYSFRAHESTGDSDD